MEEPGDGGGGGGGGTQAGAAFEPTCQLPGQKQEDDQAPWAKLRELLQAKLPVLVDGVEMVRVERHQREEMSSRFTVKTTYLRSIVTLRLREGAAPDLELYGSPGVHVTRSSSGRPSVMGAVIAQMSTQSVGQSAMQALPHANRLLAEQLLKCDMHVIHDAKDRPGLFAWLPEALFEQLSTRRARLDVIRECIVSRAAGCRDRLSSLSI
mmetsp:Transcript_81479/g.252929  ORF Transcript_81479/g.252929 Transcript_81479/m.252929 type:complete len:209 (-) Transcript_81479:2-628(-)